VLQLAYIQSIPFSPIKGYRDCVASSTVSLKASEGECPAKHQQQSNKVNFPSFLPDLLSGIKNWMKIPCTFCPEDIILRTEETVDGAHENSTLAGEVRIHLLLERGLIEVATAHTHSQSIRPLPGLSRVILQVC